MNLVVFSDNNAVKKSFSSIEKTKSDDVIFMNLNSLRKDIKNLSRKDLIYIDIAGLDNKEVKSLITFLSKQEKNKFGIIDPKNQVEDIAGLFFSNIADYINKPMLKDPLKLQRIKQAADFASCPEIEDDTTLNEEYIIVKDWESISAGKEYTFVFLYIGADNISTLKQRYNTEALGQLQNNLRNYLTNFLTSYNGKIWIWNDFNGIALFPFTGKITDAVSAACRLYLNQKIISIECMNIKNIITLRLAMHIGNTVYKARGNTGKIISDTINSIFHLGSKFVQPESFSITKDLFSHIKNGLKDNFISNGSYEGNEIYNFHIS